MVPDSLVRQFLLCQKPLFSISALQNKLGITGKCIETWMRGKRPLPSKWEQPLKELLYPMVDESNELHHQLYRFDRVVVLEDHQILPEYRHYKYVMLDKRHFPLFLTDGADVVYLKYINLKNQESYRSIYSRY